ncbi:MAG: hypothetical protein VW683_00425 [Betaproteobacteria bacterium]|jgi:hypothetical protein
MTWPRIQGEQINPTTTISASLFYGDGSNLYNLPSAAIATYSNPGDNRIITSVNATDVQGEANLTFDGSSLVVAGNVGIGTASPDTTLHISASTNVPLRISTGAGNNARIALAPDGGSDDWSIGVQTSALFTLYDVVNAKTPFKVDSNSATDSLVIAAPGNVGIGTTSPATDRLLHVEDTLHTYVRIQAGDIDGDAGLELYSDRDWIIQNDGNGSIGTADYLHIRDVTAGVSRMVFDTSGNVGINTTNPSAILHVSSSASTGRSIEMIGGSLGHALEIVDGPSYTATVPNVYIRDADNSNTRASLHIQGNNGAVDSLFVSSTGNVGIGTTDPQSKLHVQGAISASSHLNVEGNNIGLAGQWQNNSATSLDTVQIGDYSNTARGIIFATDGTADAAIAFAESVSSLSSRIVFQNEDNSIQFQTSAGSLTTRMTISGSGNVGIGTTNPDGLLTLNGANPNLRFYSTAGEVYIDASTVGDSINFRTSDSTKNDTTALTILSGGNVGIGTTNPNSALDVVGTISGSSTVYLPSIGTGQDNSVVILDSDGTLRTDEIDSRVWGTSLVDGSGVASRVAYWSDTDTLTSDADLTFDGNDLTVGRDMYLATGLFLDSSEGIYFEADGSGGHRHGITWNDGTGNFNIRVGNIDIGGTPSTQVSTENGYAFHEEYSQTNGTWDFQISSGSATIGDDLNQSWYSYMQFDADLTGQRIVVFNNSSHDIDFRVKGDTDSNLIRTDAATDTVGIGTVPDGNNTLQVNGSLQIATHFTGSSTSTWRVRLPVGTDLYD